MMVKLASITLGLVLVVFVRGAPEPQLSDDPVLKAARNGNWDEVDRLLKTRQSQFAHNPDEFFREVKNLRPAANGDVHGESSYTFHESSNINGKKTENSGGHRVVNDNGSVREYDFEPSTAA